MADAPTRLSARTAFRELPSGLGPDRLSAAALQHRGVGAVRDIGDTRLVHARGLWLCSLPFPGTIVPVHGPDRDDFPARRSDTHSDIPDLGEDGRRRLEHPVRPVDPAGP